MTIVLGDLHLSRHSRPEIAADFARLLASHPGRDVFVAGDFFDLAADAPRTERLEAARAVLGRHPVVRRAIGEHLEGGGRLVFLSGNHDADLGDGVAEAALWESLGLNPQRATGLEARPWFFRRADDGLHIEHGHFYDPDNAPAHPLIVGRDPLGVHFSSEFVRPTGAHRYLQANDDTPLRLFLAAFRWYGKRAPFVIYKYFDASFQALAQAGRGYRRRDETTAGRERHARHAEELGIPRAVVDAVFAAGAASTLESFSGTFARLYLDRVAASFFIGTGAALTLSGRRPAGVATAGLGAALMSMSWLMGHNRYRGTVLDHLDRAAAHLRDRTGASLVVFGHTHREVMADGYANTGSFAFVRDAPGRPYLEIVSRGRPEARRRYLPLR